MGFSVRRALLSVLRLDVVLLWSLFASRQVRFLKRQSAKSEFPCVIIGKETWRLTAKKLYQKKTFLFPQSVPNAVSEVASNSRCQVGRVRLV